MNLTITIPRWAIVAAACLLASVVKAASPASEAQLVAQVKSAFESRDPAKLLALVCWDRVELGMRQGIERQFSNLVKLEPTRIELVAPDPNARYEYSRAGTKYRTNLAVTKQLRVEFKPNELNTTEVTMPLGEKDGRVLITTAAPIE